MRIRNYQTEILKILKTNGGCITGFNRLLKMGNFHPNTLAKYLKEMSKQKLITITKTDVRNKQRRYCIINLDIENSFKELTADFKSIENDLAKKDLTSDEKTFLLGNYARLAFYKYQGLDAAKLYSEYVILDKIKIRAIEVERERLWEMITDTILKAPYTDRTRIIHSLFESPTEILSLEQYRYWRRLYPHN